MRAFFRSAPMKRGLSNNQLKILAMIAMTLDHVGAYLFPQVVWLRLVGRLAFPIYAFMIAEGCRHTRNGGRYLGSLVILAVVCQVVSFVAMGSLYQCIMVTFSLSVGLILLIRHARKKKSFLSWLWVGLGTATVLFLCQGLPRLLPGTDYSVDYGFVGVMTPVLVYLCAGKLPQLLVLALCLAGQCLDAWWGQVFALAAVPLIALYNGTRGKWKLKWFFYLFYPAHLVLIYLVGMFL